MNTLKAMAAPYQHLGLKYIPLGGLSLKNMASYLESSLIAGLGGSWLAPRDLIQAEQWDRIEANARDAAAIVGEIRSR